MPQLCVQENRGAEDYTRRGSSISEFACEEEGIAQLEFPMMP